MVVDLEQALISAVETELLNTAVEGCCLYFSQSLVAYLGVETGAYVQA